MRTDSHAWAIDSRSSEGHGLLGVYMWYYGWPPEIPMHMNGYKTAIWRTRSQARKVLPRVKKTWPKAKVVKVYVKINIA